MTQEFDFVAIGDVVSDAFVDLKEVKITQPEVGPPQMTMAYGEKVPYNWHVIVEGVGNSANAAVSAYRLGLHTAYVANVGDDAYGTGQINALKANGIDTKFIAVHPGKTSNYHYVLMYNADRTILVKHTEYDYKLPDIGSPKWIYLSSLAENSLPHHYEIADYLESHPDVNMAFQPGTFQIQLGIKQLERIYKRTKLFFCNVEEAKRILYPVIDGFKDKVESTEKDSGRKEAVKLMLEAMMQFGVQIPVITDGPMGAYARDVDGSMYYIPMYPDPKPPISRTGAGDACASTFTAIYAETGDVKTALRYGPVNSMNVVQHVGAQGGLMSREQIEEWLAKAPAEYVVTKIN